VTRLENLGKVIDTDALVVGGGIAGLWAATRAREFVESVLIVDKGSVNGGGQALRAGGDFDAVLPEEDVNEFLEDLVYYYDGLCEQDLIEELLKHSFDRMMDYERLGHHFFRGSDGKLKGIPQRGLKHVKCYVYRPYGTGGKNMVGVLSNKANMLGIKRLGRICITDLLKTDGKVVGAVGFNIINADFYIIRAKAVILTTGIDGVVMSLRAGAEQKNCEFVNIGTRTKDFAWEGLTSLLPFGAKYVNSNGEHFMDKYSPLLGSNTDYNYIAISMAFEERRGRGPFYVDCSEIKPEDLELMMPETGWQHLNHKKLLHLGINFFESKSECVPIFRLGGGGGIVVDRECYTKVPGLFAAGTKLATDTGVYIGGWNLCKTAVTGSIAGESAGKYARSAKPFQIDAGEVETGKRQLYSRFDKDGISPREVLKNIQKIMRSYEVTILKNDVSLNNALKQVITVRNELLPQVAAEDAHYLMKSIEAGDMVLGTELFLRASLLRTESRAGHYREDYPNRDDMNWLKWIIFSEKYNKLNTRTEALPLNRYKFKPTRYYMDNFRFPQDRG
jgi:succinate dehydrogenase/fumarate reductase flavoprotein subunit